MSQALHNGSWVQDIKGAPTVEVLLVYLHVWDFVDGFILQTGVPDNYRSAYAAFFVGFIKFGLWIRIWKTWAPQRCKFFIWLVFHNRVWTADQLTKRNLPHPEFCPFLDQVDESMKLYTIC